ncbi:MAG: ribbon-helix-helix domain-containing protein [Pseudomonadota bacterium]
MKLFTRNVRVGARRTSIRLTTEEWLALAKVCECAGETEHDYITRVSALRRDGTLTATIRAQVVRDLRRLVEGAEAKICDDFETNALFGGPAQQLGAMAEAQS